MSPLAFPNVPGASRAVPPVDIPALRAIAQAATPGTWHGDEYAGYVWGPNGEMVADHGTDRDADRREAEAGFARRKEPSLASSTPLLRMRGVGGGLPIGVNRAHICAFSPEPVLALLDELEALRAQVAARE